jgi:hypothetical protein
MKKITEFFKSLFDVTSNTDEKIVVGFMSFAVMVIIAMVTLFTGLTLPFEMFATFATLTFGCFGLGTYSAIKSTDAKTSLASDIVKSDSSEASNATAQEIIQNDKPS